MSEIGRGKQAYVQRRSSVVQFRHIPEAPVAVSMKRPDSRRASDEKADRERGEPERSAPRRGRSEQCRVTQIDKRQRTQSEQGMGEEETVRTRTRARIWRRWMPWRPTYRREDPNEFQNTKHAWRRKHRAGNATPHVPTVRGMGGRGCAVGTASRAMNRAPPPKSANVLRAASTSGESNTRFPMSRTSSKTWADDHQHGRSGESTESSAGCDTQCNHQK
jgi:hypothetical protein